MARKPCVEFILLLINLIFTVSGLGTIGFGLVCFLRWKQNPSNESNIKFLIAHRLWLAVDPSTNSSDPLHKAWFIYLIIGIGAILFIISCFGCVGTATRSPCCLLSYCVFLVALVIVELGTAAFIFFEHNWKEVIDRSGNFHAVYHFLNVNWKVIRWVALGILILQVIAIVLAVYLGSVFNRALYDDGDEHIVYFPQARTPNYRMLARTRSTPSSATSATNGRDPTLRP